MSNSIHLTCIFKIHNPSAHKRAVMDYALREYTLAYQGLLDWARDNDDLLREMGKVEKGWRAGEYTGDAIRALLPRPELALHGSAKDSLMTDVAGNLASYYALGEMAESVGFPMGRDPAPAAFDDALDHFAGVGADLDDENEARRRLLSRAKAQFMPLFFCRADGASSNRNFALLWSVQKRQLLAGLWLLPKGHAISRPLGANSDSLVCLKTGAVFASNSASAILVPLEIGRNGWQEEKFLNACAAGDAEIKTGMLARDDRSGDYFLHVAFKFPLPKCYTPAAYLGIDKGILYTAAYALVDRAGVVLEMSHFDDALRALQLKHGREREQLARNGQKITKRHYRQKAYDNILHALANTLIDAARVAQAAIVVEDLNVQVRGGRVVSRFRKLDRILEYKCKLAGVPFRRVFAAYSSVICHRCGADMDRDNRTVTCKACGYVGHSDDNAAVNIARRALYCKADWEGGYREFHRSFADVGTFTTK